MEGWLYIGGFIAVIAFIGWISELYQRGEKVGSLTQTNYELRKKIAEWEAYADGLATQEKQINQKQILFKKLLKERTENFPLIGRVWQHLIEVTEDERAKALKYKARPALKAAEEVQKVGREKRELAKELVHWRYKAQNYEAIYPWLEEELKEDIEDQVDSDVYFSVYTDQEREDPVAQFINPEDYRKLSVADRNQLALDRYWQRGKKTKWMIGKMYERYIGYIYEKDGWQVEYFGIHKRFEDLGRDIVATKGNDIHIVQCKNWSKFKTIYENHIFQLFGTSYSVHKENPGKRVTPVFYASTVLSETANEFARRLGIVVHQNYKFSEYPCIKCNTTPKGEKIYHLPFDQQYDHVKITPGTKKFYAKTVAEAEAAGFRRAFRWHGSANS
jgi:hypothetical protein